MRYAARRTLRILAIATPLTAGLASPSHAACNAIPVAERWFPSDRGSIDQPIAAPGESVDLRLDPSCPQEKRKFESTDTVSLRYESPRGGEVEWTPVFQVLDDWHMRVTIPDTVDAALGRPNGLAGPARITVTTSSGQPVAQIWRLNEPTSGCDRQPEEIFESFTVLPRPNDISTATQLLATVDGGNNLLIPLDHTQVVPQGGADPLAVFEYAAGLFPQFKGSGKKIAKAVAEALAAGASPTDYVQVYSLRGQLLPALARFDSKGSLFGTADATYAPLPLSRSVLRFPRSAGGPKLYNVVHLLGGSGPEDGTHPIVLKKGSANPDVQMTVCNQTIELAGLRTSAEVVAYSRGPGASTGTIQIHDAQLGGQSCGTNTLRSAASSPTLGVSRPQVEVGRRSVAFAQAPAAAGASRLRVYNALGQEDSTPPTVVPLLGAMLDGHSLAVSDPFVFFAVAPPALRAFDTGTDSLRPAAQTPMLSGAVSSARAAVLTPSFGIDVYDGGSDQRVTLVTTGATRVAISPQIVAFTSGPGAVAAGAPGTLMVQTLPLPTTPVPENTGVKADAIAAVGSTVVFITPESAETAGSAGCMPTSPAGGCDLNGDGDANDRVLRLFVTAGTAPEETHLPATDFVATPHYIAFRSPEAQQNVLDPLCGIAAGSGCDRNGDQDANDDVMLVYDRSSQTTFSTGQAASRCDVLCTQLGLEWMMPYAIRGEQLFFLTNELQQVQDLNGDGVISNLDVLQIFDLPSKRIWSVGAMSPGAGAAAVPIIQALGETPPFLRVVQQSNPKALDSFVAGDRDGDGTLDPFDTCADSPNPAQADDDCDRLGDRVCDPTYCTTFVPQLQPGWQRGGELSCKQRNALQNYLETRATAARRCFDALARGALSGDPAVVCRGYFVNGVQVLPEAPPANDAVREATLDLWKTLGVLAGKASHRKPTAERATTESAEVVRARRLVQSYGESVNAVTRVAYGDLPRPLRGIQLDCQRRLGEASLEYLVGTVEAMRDCLRDAEGAADAAARCLGSVRDEHVVPPADESTRCALDRLTTGVRAATSSDACAQSLGALDACGDDPNGTAACITCVAWRRAVESVLNEYRAPDQPAGACDRPRAPIKIPAPRHGTEEQATDAPTTDG